VYCNAPQDINSKFSGKWPAQCPSESHVLFSFALVNIIVALCSTILENQYVLHWISVGFLGKEHTHPKRRHQYIQGFQYFLPLSLQLIADASIAALIKATPDSGQGFTIAQMFLFYAAQPRVS
jgi:hypothetical protein